jgi:predicted RecB family nuclease
MKFWKFGGQKYLPLSLVTDFLEIPTPKTEMDGSKVNTVYWPSCTDEMLKSISKYNEEDVRATIDLVVKLSKY